MFDNYFKNKKVVIIGASGSLGRVYTRAFHQAGARLFLLGRDIEKLKIFVQEFSSFIPISSVDITSEESLKNVVSEIQEWSECIDIVINATGFDVRKSLSAHSLEDIEQTLLINLSGAILISKIFLPLLANEKGATIVHSGGFADGRLAFPYYSVDVASRAGIFSFIESMNRELKHCHRCTSYGRAFTGTHAGRKSTALSFCGVIGVRRAYSIGACGRRRTLRIIRRIH